MWGRRARGEGARQPRGRCRGVAAILAAWPPATAGRRVGHLPRAPPPAALLARREEQWPTARRRRHCPPPAASASGWGVTVSAAATATRHRRYRLCPLTLMAAAGDGCVACCSQSGEGEGWPTGEVARRYIAPNAQGWRGGRAGMTAHSKESSRERLLRPATPRGVGAGSSRDGRAPPLHPPPPSHPPRAAATDSLRRSSGACCPHPPPGTSPAKGQTRRATGAPCDGAEGRDGARAPSQRRCLVERQKERMDQLAPRTTPTGDCRRPITQSWTDRHGTRGAAHTVAGGGQWPGAPSRAARIDKVGGRLEAAAAAPGVNFQPRRRSPPRAHHTVVEADHAGGSAADAAAGRPPSRAPSPRVASGAPHQVESAPPVADQPPLTIVVAVVTGGGGRVEEGS